MVQAMLRKKHTEKLYALNTRLFLLMLLFFVKLSLKSFHSLSDSKLCQLLMQNIKN